MGFQQTPQCWSIMASQPQLVPRRWSIVSMPLRACLRRSQPLVPEGLNTSEHKNKQNRVGEVFQKAHGCICIKILIMQNYLSDFETYSKVCFCESERCQKQYHTIAGGSSDRPKVDGQAVFLQRDQAPGHPSIEIDSQRSYCPKTNQHLPNTVDLTGTHENLKLFKPTMMGLS